MDIFTTVIYFVMLYSILTPLALPWMSYAWAYDFYFPASLLGLWMSMLFWLNHYGALQTPYSFGIAFVIAFVILFLVHYSTREGFTRYIKSSKIIVIFDLSTINRVGISIVAPLFVLVNAVFSLPQVLEQNLGNAILLICFLLILYVSFSAASLNITYRAKLLGKRLQVGDFRIRMRENERNLLNRHKNNPDQAEFFSFLVRSAALDFIYGDYERSFLDNYRVIHDEILRPLNDIRVILTNKMDNKKWEELRCDRVFLMHGMLEKKTSKRKIPITAEDVLRTRKRIFVKSLELVELAFYLAERL